MGCFIACLGCTKKPKRLKSDAARHQGLGSYEQLESVSVNVDVKKESSTCHEAGSDLKEEKLTLRSVLGARKKVSFNLNVRTYELINSQDYSECAEEEKMGKEQVGAGEIKEVSTAAYPSNYRYKNFIDGEDEDDDGVESNDSCYDDDDDEDEYDDCLEDCCDDDDHDHELELDRSTEGKSVLRNAHSVLSPVENTAQWRAVKLKTPSAQSKHQCKENVENIHQEIRVDASLSIWIAS